MTTGNFLLRDLRDFLGSDARLPAPRNPVGISPPPTPKIQLAIIDDATAFDALRSEWDALYAASPVAAPPLSWRWAREWWRVYGPIYGNHGRGLRILTLRQGNSLVGVLPMYVGQKSSGGITMTRLTCLTDGACEFEETCADYQGLLHAPGMEAACVDIIARELKHSPRLKWDELKISNMRSTVALASLASAFEGSRYRAVAKQLEGSHICDMTGGFDAYLGRLSARNRKQARAVLRDVESSGLQFEVAATPDQAGEFFDQMVDLHRKRWTSRGKAGSFSPHHAQFHRTVLLAGTAAGTTFIGRLAQDGTPISLFYGHRAGQNFHCYQQGTDTSATTKVRSPGIAAALLSMRHAAGAGVTLFDFEQGLNPFKERFCTGVRPLVDLRVVELNFHSVSYAAMEMGKRAMRKLLRKMRKKAAPIANDEGGNHVHSETSVSPA